MAIWLPRLPSDRLIRSGKVAPGKHPLVVYAKAGNAYAITSLDRQASKVGLRVGMPLADARAMQPHLVAVEADEQADAALLDRIATWCDRYSPIVVKDPPHGLFIDLTGCSHLFGGDGAVLSDIEKRLTRQGFISRSAIAPTPGAAWAMSRASLARLADEETLSDLLAPLPVSALRLEESALTLMKRLGLETIGQIMDGPRKPFTARAGRHAMMRLDQAFGRTREVLTPHRPPPEQFALRRLVEPILSMEAVMTVAESLTEELCGRLSQDGKGALLFRLHLFGVDNRTREVELGLSRAENNPAIVLRLLGERLGMTPGTLDAEFGFDALRLDAHEILPVILRPIDLAPVSLRDREAEARLVDRLAVRLGDSSIGRPSVRLVHAPERANRWTKLPLMVDAPPLAEDGVVRRPLTLFRRAQPVTAISPCPTARPGASPGAASPMTLCAPKAPSASPPTGCARQTPRRGTITGSRTGTAAVSGSIAKVRARA